MRQCKAVRTIASEARGLGSNPTSKLTYLRLELAGAEPKAKLTPAGVDRAFSSWAEGGAKALWPRLERAARGFIVGRSGVKLGRRWQPHPEQVALVVFVGRRG